MTLSISRSAFARRISPIAVISFNLLAFGCNSAPPSDSRPGNESKRGELGNQLVEATAKFSNSGAVATGRGAVVAPAIDASFTRVLVQLFEPNEEWGPDFTAFGLLGSTESRTEDGLASFTFGTNEIFFRPRDGAAYLRTTRHGEASATRLLSFDKSDDARVTFRIPSRDEEAPNLYLEIAFDSSELSQKDFLETSYSIYDGEELVVSGKLTVTLSPMILARLFTQVFENQQKV